MRRDLFQFDLPDELIAKQPAAQRQGSRLLYLDSQKSDLRHQQFADLLGHIAPGDLMVFLRCFDCYRRLCRYLCRSLLGTSPRTGPDQ